MDIIKDNNTISLELATVSAVDEAIVPLAANIHTATAHSTDNDMV